MDKEIKTWLTIHVSVKDVSMCRSLGIQLNLSTTEVKKCLLTNFLFFTVLRNLSIYT